MADETLMQLLDTEPTNRSRWILNLQPREAGEVLDLDSAVIVLSVRDKSNKSNVLTASTANGKILVEADIVDNFSETSTDGWFQIRFTEDDMRDVCPGMYDIGCTITFPGEDGPDQLFIGTVAIADGVVE